MKHMTRFSLRRKRESCVFLSHAMTKVCYFVADGFTMVAYPPRLWVCVPVGEDVRGSTAVLSPLLLRHAPDSVSTRLPVRGFPVEEAVPLRERRMGRLWEMNASNYFHLCQKEKAYVEEKHRWKSPEWISPASSSWMASKSDFSVFLNP